MKTYYWNKKSYILILTLIVGLVALLTGCGATNEATEGGQVEDKTTEVKETENKGTEESYTVEHAMGSTTIKGTPKRVVILTNHGTEALLSLGVTPVGAVQSWTGDPWYEHISEKMKGVEVVGLESQVNIEKIVELKPDLIIGNKMRQEKIYEQLSAIAPTVFEETLRGDWKVNFELIAKAMNMEEKGNQVLEGYENRIAQLQEKLGDQLSQKISIIRFLAGDVRIYQKDSFSGIILDDIGFARPESQDVDAFAEKNVSKERIPEMDGDKLFYFTYDKGDGKGNKVEEEWINDPLFKNLSVAKSGQVYKVSDQVWNTAGGVIAANLMLDDIEKYFLGE